MKLLSLSIAIAFVALAGAFSAGTSQAAIHEIVSAYCSGGDVGVIDADGFLEAPGVAFPDGQAPARPVLASGAVVLDPGPETGNTPNLKYDSGIDLTQEDALNEDTVDHPSAEHCPGAESLPDAS